MKREIRYEDKVTGKTHTEVKNGKTLKDSLESYFYTMSSDKANEIIENENIQSFYNSYRDKDGKMDFAQELAKRAA